jgi:hypothetical protein
MPTTLKAKTDGIASNLWRPNTLMNICVKGILMMYRCILTDSKGYILENFLRDGASEKEVLESLESFEWPKGDWQVYDPSINEDD